MTTIHVSQGHDDLEAVARQMTFTAGTEVETIQCGELGIVSTRVDDLDLWGHATDPDTGVTVVLGGRVAFPEARWDQAQSLPYEGGLASRLILDAFLDDSGEPYDALNGNYGVLIYDPTDGELHLITDRLGVYPFYTNREGEKAIASHPDVLATNLDRDVHIDKVTLAEVLSRAESVFPYTYYEEIRQLAPSTHFRFAVDSGLELVDSTEYWYPDYLDGTLEWNRDKLVRELSDAITKAVQLRTHSWFENPGVLLSGGIDSRSCLFGMEEPSKATALTYTSTEPDREFEVARQLARTAGAEQVRLTREAGHYLQCRDQAAKTSAGMYDFADDHMSPFVERIRRLDLDVLLSGCYSDYLFKGLADNLDRVSVMGKTLPFKRVGEYEHSYYLPHHDISEEYESLVEDRWQARYEPAIDGSSDLAPYIAEDRRMRPMSCEADIAFRSIMWRTLPWDHLISDRHILDVYGRVPIEIKKDKQFYEDVVLATLPDEARMIPNADTGMRLGLNKYQKLYRLLKRKIESGDESDPAAEDPPLRSMQELAVLLQSEESEARADWVDRTPTEEDAFESILGYSPWNVDLSEWDEGKKHFAYRIATLHFWLRQREEVEFAQPSRFGQ